MQKGSPSMQSTLAAASATLSVWALGLNLIRMVVYAMLIRGMTNINSLLQASSQDKLDVLLGLCNSNT